jgi:sugar-specific transcriptional regulator TrmB
LKKFNDEVGDLNKEIESERQAREENEQAIFDMLKDVVDRVKREIEIEKTDRLKTEENLLGLLEETCGKLNTATHGL